MRSKDNQICLAGLRDGIILSLLACAVIFSTALAASDSDLDGIPDNVDAFPYDFDNDGMPDAWEKRNGLNYTVDDSLLDIDGDGITNLEEFLGGSTNSATVEISDGSDSTKGGRFNESSSSGHSEEMFAPSGGVSPLILSLFVAAVLAGSGIAAVKTRQKKDRHSLPKLPSKLQPKRHHAASHHHGAIAQPDRKIMVQIPGIIPAKSLNQAHSAGPSSAFQEDFIPLESLSSQIRQKPISAIEKLKKHSAPDEDIFGKLSRYTSQYKSGKNSMEDMFR